MALWYVSSVQYGNITAWAAVTTYAVGDIRRQTAPTAGNERAFRVSSITTGISGASEPTWVLTKAATTTDSGVTWTEVTGNSTYGWSAASKYLSILANTAWAANGDTIYVGSDHNYSSAATLNYGAGALNSILQIICVNPAGSVPPVAADVTTGAVESTSGSMNLSGAAVWVGMKMQSSKISTSSALSVTGLYNKFTGGSQLSISGAGQCALNVGTNSTVELSNCTINFGNAASSINLSTCEFTWRNTSSAIAGTAPTTKLFGGNAIGSRCVVEGCDISAVNAGNLVSVASGNTATRFSFVNCKLGASVGITSIPVSTSTVVDVIISDSSGTGYRQERHWTNADLTTELTDIRTAGASDGTTGISWKVVTGANLVWGAPFACFPISIWNTTLSSRTATIAIMNDGTTLTNADIWVDFEVLDSSGSPRAGLYTTAITNILTAGTNITTDTLSTWTTTGITTPVKQQISATFTPAIAGFIRAWVYVAKPSKTLYIDPLIQLS